MNGYFHAVNSGNKPLNFSEARSSAFGSVSIYRTIQKNDGSISMIPVDMPLEIQTNETTTFAPGGYHLMLRSSQKDIEPGGEVELTFATESGANYTVSFVVRNATTGRGGLDD
ncbi:copper chaperone PCu(A)C [Aquisalimonas lutea]|uniref:copper chaperone PCu(A)C n=1 Tax=Aquisalimonas lutea TaxID=1327750 RepID=UPI0025B41AAB|nr:copper chaperone PCu(A)C [Aquisalimonas lutea]MDN3519097.1 copper chaperone PCu(A)C [Aquisalimonas lutea]